jgi:hypothetical protein
VNNGIAMKMFQVIFQTGRVQNLMADSWSNEVGTVRFKTDGKETAAFPAPDLIMIDQLDEAGGYMPRRRLQTDRGTTR